jgi:hypothetical protein
LEAEALATGVKRPKTQNGNRECQPTGIEGHDFLSSVGSVGHLLPAGVQWHGDSSPREATEQRRRLGMAMDGAIAVPWLKAETPVQAAAILSVFRPFDSAFAPAAMTP